jgi:ubiquinone/menaquinone biosynthesis C-methylase UbiE
VAPDIEWREGNAIDLPLLEKEAFDVIVCQQGLQFFPDKPAAAAEMRRASKKGGRLAVATWRPDDEIPFMRDLRQVAERHVGAIVDQRHSSGDASTLEALLKDAGFHEVRVRTVSRTIRFNGDVNFERMNAMALVGMSAAGKTMNGDERMRAVDAITRESMGPLQSYTVGSEIVYELSTNLATAKG